MTETPFLIDGIPSPSNHIDGLGLEWVDQYKIKVNVGAAYVPGLGEMVSVESDIIYNFVVPQGSYSVHWVYLTRNAVTLEPTIVVSTTQPDTPYMETAQTMTGNTSNRYLGMLRFDGVGALLPFIDTVFHGNVVLRTWGAGHTDADIKCVGPSTNTTPATQILGPASTNPARRLVSPMTRIVSLFAMTTTSVGRLGHVTPGTGGLTPPFYVEKNANLYVPDVTISPAQELTYMLGGGGGQLNAYLISYYERR